MYFTILDIVWTQFFTGTFPPSSTNGQASGMDLILSKFLNMNLFSLMIHIEKEEESESEKGS
jgi:hypothetical protein